MILNSASVMSPQRPAGNPWSAVMPRKVDGSPVVEDSVSLSGSAPAAGNSAAVAPRDLSRGLAAGVVGAGAPGIGAPLQLVLLGSPGSCKAVQAERVAREYNVPHISVGSLLREEIATGSELGRKLESAISRGETSPATLVHEILERRFERPDVAQGFVLDGYPRDLATIPAIESFRQEHGLTNLRVVELEDNQPRPEQLPVIQYFRERGEYYTLETEDGQENIADCLSALVVNFSANPAFDYQFAR